MQFDASDAEILILTYKEGVLSRVAHDLKLRCEGFSVNWTDEGIEATFDPRSIVAVNAMKRGRENPKALSAKDRRQVIENMHRSVLHTDDNGVIRFISSSVEQQGNGLRIEGSLTLHGVERELSILARRLADKWIADVTLHQPDFGIKPFTALMGAIKMKPDVLVRLSVPAS